MESDPGLYNKRVFVAWSSTESAGPKEWGHSGVQQKLKEYWNCEYRVKNQENGNTTEYSHGKLVAEKELEVSL
jgi:hypothetical protein